MNPINNLKSSHLLPVQFTDQNSRSAGFGPNPFGYQLILILNDVSLSYSPKCFGRNGSTFFFTILNLFQSNATNMVQKHFFLTFKKSN